MRRPKRRSIGFLAALVAVVGTLALAGATSLVPSAKAGSPTAYHTVVLGDHPVAYWRLDEASGATTALDSAGSNPGSYKGGVTLGQPGAIPNEPSETSASFDGTSGYVVVPDAPALDLTSAVSLELWAKRRAVSGTYQVLVAKPGNGQSKLENYALWLNSSNDFQAYFGNGSTYIHLESNAITDTKWHYVVATYDGSVARLYLDGAQVGSRSATTGMAANTLPLNMGRANGGGNFFNGWLDDVAVYPSALTAAQVAAHYSAANSVAPNVTLTSPASGSYVTTSSTTLSGVGGTASGDAGSVTVNIYSGTNASGPPAQTVTATVGSGGAYSISTPLADGTWTAQATQTNSSSGKTGVSSATTFTVDTTPPKTTIGSSPTNPSYSTSATFTFGANEPVTGFQCSLDGGSFSGCSSPVTYSTLPNGSHTFQVRSTDLAGNVGSPASYTWTVQGLQTPTITSGPSATTNSPNATFAFSDADPTLALVCSLDGAPFTSCASPLSYSGLADGTHSFQVEALDSIGDASAAASASWTVDTAAPAVSLAAPANGATPNVFPTFTGTGGTASGDAGSVLINVYSGSSPSGSLTEAVPASLGASGAFSALSTSLLQPGVYTAQAKQLDAAGNVGLSSAATFTVGDPVILAAGDIAGCDFDFADAKATGALLNTVPDALVVPLGDNAYPHGQPSEYQNCYGTTWGSALGRTRPIVGGHDFDNVAGGATPGSGYLGYFASNLAPFGPTATDPTKLYYSYDVGTWHVVVLNDGCLEGYTPGCNEKGQEQWLINDLATHPAPCTLALYHEPRWSSGNIHGDTQPTEAFWNILYQYGVDLVLNGSEHWYERFAPQDAAGSADSQFGMRELVAGTGGYGLYSLGTLQPNSEVHSSNFGVLKLTLHPAGYDWQFLPIPGETFTDSGSGSCHGAPPPVSTAPTVRSTTQASANAATSLSLSVPASTSAGDLLVAVVAHQGGTATDVTPPTGWTLVPGSDTAQGTNGRVDAYTHFAVDGDPTSAVFTLSSAQDVIGTISDISGASAVSPVNAVLGQANATSSNFIQAPSVTTSVPGSLLLYAGAMSIAGTLEPPPFMTELSEGSTGGTFKVSLELASEGQASAGATGTLSGYVIFNSAPSVGLTLAIAPQ